MVHPPSRDLQRIYDAAAHRHLVQVACLGPGVAQAYLRSELLASIRCSQVVLYLHRVCDTAAHSATS